MMRRDTDSSEFMLRQVLNFMQASSIPSISRRRFLYLGASSSIVVYLKLERTAQAEQATPLSVSPNDLQLAIAGFKTNTLTDPAKRQQAINALILSWADLSQAKTSDVAQVTANLNQQFESNQDLGIVFTKMQAMLNANTPDLTDQPYAKQIYQELPTFAGLVDPALGVALSLIADLNPSQAYGNPPSQRFDALGTIVLGNLQALIDINGAALNAVNQSNIGTQLSLTFSTSADAPKDVSPAMAPIIKLSKDPATGVMDIATCLSDISSATQTANQQYSTNLNQAATAADPSTAVQIANATYQRDLGEIRGAVAIASALASSIFGDSQAGKVIAGVGTAAIGMAVAINLFAAGTMGPLGLASSLLGGISAITSLFGGGPTADEEILKGLNQLGSQIQAFWKDMDAQLAVVEKQQSLILDKLQALSDALFTAQQVLQSDIQVVGDQISQLTQISLNANRTQYKVALTNVAGDVSQISHVAKGVVDLNTFQSYEEDVNMAFTYATDICLQPEFTGALTPFVSGQNLLFADRISEDPDSNNLVAIAAWIASQYGVSTPTSSTLANPDEWARGANAFLQMNAASIGMRDRHTAPFYAELDRESLKRYGQIHDIGTTLASTIIGSLTSVNVALHACSGYVEAFSNDDTFRSEPGAANLPTAMPAEQTLCSLMKQVFQVYVAALVPTYALVHGSFTGSDPNYASTSGSVMTSGGYTFLKATNNPWDWAVNNNQLILNQVATVSVPNLAFGIGATPLPAGSSQYIAYRVTTALGTPFLPGQLVVQGGEWYLYPDNGTFNAQTAAGLFGFSGTPAFADFTPAIKAAHDVLRSEYLSSQMRKNFGSYLEQNLPDSNCAVFIDCSARYRLIAAYVRRRFAYSDSSDYASVYNVPGWFSKDDVCNAVANAIAGHSETIDADDWWTTIQKDLTESLIASAKVTLTSAQGCDARRSFPSVDDALRQIDVIKSLQQNWQSSANQTRHGFFGWLERLFHSR